MSFRRASFRTRSPLAICLAVLGTAFLPSVSFAAQHQHLGERTLQQGDRGHDVRVLQDFLTRAGFKTPIAGVFGPETLRNVKRFERARHLAVDGIVGPAVVHALRHVAAQRATTAHPSHGRGSSAPSRHLGDRTLKQGMKGHDVRVLQDYLTRAGFPTPIAGLFGPLTLANVKAFERAHGLADDGVVGPAVVGALHHVGDGGSAHGSGGADSQPSAPIGHARLRSDGTAVAPSDAPPAIKAVIAAGNRIATKPYVWGGGHGSWSASGYDCSGSVSYALHGGGLLSSPLVSGDFARWGSSGRGRWITIYANGGHVFMTVAGLRFDTSGANPSRWQSDMRSSGGYAITHPTGY